MTIGRREFIATLGSAAAAWSVGASAQQTGKVIRLGFLGVSLNSPPPIAYYQAYLARLRELGFSEGQSLVAEYGAVDDPRGPFMLYLVSELAPAILAVGLSTG